MSDTPRTAGTEGDRAPTGSESGPENPDTENPDTENLDTKNPVAEPPHATIERPSGEVERPAGTARLPGARRDGYRAFPTGPVSVEPIVASGPDADSVGAPVDAWEPSPAELAVDDTRLAPWALLAAIVALVTSFFVGWGIPVAIVAVIAASMSLRRPVESRSIARWALVLGLCAMVYSLGWLVWAGMQFERLG